MFLFRRCVQIANEPPPTREIPPDCSNLTAELIKAGLQKDPVKRASAAVLKEKTSRALTECKSNAFLGVPMASRQKFKAGVTRSQWLKGCAMYLLLFFVTVGGLRSPVRGPYTEPLQITPGPCLDHGDTPEDELVLEEEEEEEREEEEEERGELTGGPISPGSKKKFGSEGDDGDGNGNDNPEAEAGTVGGRAREQSHRRDSLNHKTQGCHVTSTPVSDHELHKLERGTSPPLDTARFTTCVVWILAWVLVLVCVWVWVS